MTILASKSVFSSHWTALESYVGMLAASFEDTYSETQQHGWAAYLGVAPLVCKVSRVDQDIATGQLDGGIVGVADAHDPGPPCRTTSSHR